MAAMEPTEVEYQIHQVVIPFHTQKQEMSI